MGKWVGILVLVIIALAVVGFLVDAVRVIAWILLAVCLIGLAVQVFRKRSRKDG